MTYFPPHILIAEDNREHREALAHVFAGRGYRVTAVADGLEALRTVAGAHVDVLLTDLRMPRLGGMALLRVAREIRPDIPVIVITAYGDDVTAGEAGARGAVAFLRKPIRRDQILAATAAALG